MANDSDNVVVGASGTVYLAPLATALPVDVTTALPGAWKDVGFVNEDGVTLKVDDKINTWGAWQSRTPIRRDRDTTDVTMSFAMREFKRDNFITAMGGGTWALIGTSPNQTIRYTPPSPSSRLTQYACVLEWVDGGVKFRLAAPIVERISVGDIKLSRANPIDLDVTLAIIDDVGDGGWTLLAPDDFITAWPLT